MGRSADAGPVGSAYPAAGESLETDGVGDSDDYRSTDSNALTKRSFCSGVPMVTRVQ
jgi:hypothetical protein